MGPQQTEALLQHGGGSGFLGRWLGATGSFGVEQISSFLIQESG
jgi:hypothetical protein